MWQNLLDILISIIGSVLLSRFLVKIYIEKKIAFNFNKQLEEVKAELKLYENKTNFIENYLKDIISPKHSELLKTHEIEHLDKFWLNFLKIDKHSVFSYGWAMFFDKELEKETFIALYPPKELFEEIKKTSFEAEGSRL